MDRTLFLSTISPSYFIGNKISKQAAKRKLIIISRYPPWRSKARKQIIIENFPKLARFLMPV
jgi:hypothetical protein